MRLGTQEFVLLSSTGGGGRGNPWAKACPKHYLPSRKRWEIRQWRASGLTINSWLLKGEGLRWIEVYRLVSVGKILF